MKVRPLPSGDYPALRDHGMVGDGRSVALVTSQGSVDWWCPERFDASSVFARLVDRSRGGHFAVGLPVRHKRHFAYESDTNVLKSVFETSDTRVVLTTFMPYLEAKKLNTSRPRILRLLECERGEVDVTVEFSPAFDYAQVTPRVTDADGGVIAQGDGEFLALASTAPVEAEGDRARCTFRAREGDRHAFLLEHAREPPGALPGDVLKLVDEALDETRAYWREWVSRCTYDGAYRDQVVRSLLALKLLQYNPTGAFAAAPTTSLPETPGGERNWDYRYAWLRDGVFIVMALQMAGYRDESDRFKAWLASVARRDAPDRIQMLYRVDGGRDLPEAFLDHLDGYRRSRPVRIGNQAAEQHQLDSYGEMLMCFPLADKLFQGSKGQENWEAVRGIVEWVCDHWHEPDSGLWELRGRRRHYVYSKAMAWAALDHGLRVAENHGFDAPTGKWEDVKGKIKALVLGEGFDDAFGSFTQATDRPDSDASNLILPTIGLVDADDPRMRATVDRAMADLENHGLVQRYVVDDELPGNEGAFLVATFWLADALANQGRVDEARTFFERAARLGGPLGLLAEEADPVTDEMTGNYPQALSHLGLILTAFKLDAAEKDWDGLREEERARREAIRPA